MTLATALGVSSSDLIAVVGGGKEALLRALAGHQVTDGNPDDADPFSAPLPGEPFIPAEASVVVAAIDALALGKVIADRCQRPLRVAAAAACSPYQRLTPERALKALTNEQRGWGKNVPSGARFLIAITNATPDNPLVAELYERSTLEGVRLLIGLKYRTSIDWVTPKSPRSRG